MRYTLLFITFFHYFVGKLNVFMYICTINVPKLKPL